MLGVDYLSLCQAVSPLPCRPEKMAQFSILETCSRLRKVFPGILELEVVRSTYKRKWNKEVETSSFKPLDPAMTRGRDLSFDQLFMQAI